MDPLHSARLEILCGKVFNECCLKTLARIPDDFIDLVITSPPYNMNLRVSNGRYIKRSRTDPTARKYEHFDDAMLQEDYLAHHTAVLQELLRVSPIVFYNVSIVSGSKRSLFALIGAFNEQLKDIIIWDKGHGEPAALTGVINRQMELILVFHRTDAITRAFAEATFGRGRLSDVWHIKRQPKKSDINGATFPEALVERILENFSVEGAVVYDPFMGSGTTAVVAEKMGRYWFGSDIVPEACAETMKNVGRK